MGNLRGQFHGFFADRIHRMPCFSRWPDIIQPDRPTYADDWDSGRVHNILILFATDPQPRAGRRFSQSRSIRGRNPVVLLCCCLDRTRARLLNQHHQPRLGQS